MYIEYIDKLTVNFTLHDLQIKYNKMVKSASLLWIAIFHQDHCYHTDRTQCSVVAFWANLLKLQELTTFCHIFLRVLCKRILYNCPHHFQRKQMIIELSSSMCPSMHLFIHPSPWYLWDPLKSHGTPVLTHCGLVTPYGDIDRVHRRQGNVRET